MPVTVTSQATKPSALVKAAKKVANKTLPKQKDALTLQVEQFILLHDHLQQINAFDLMKEYEAAKKKLHEVAANSDTATTESHIFTTSMGEVVFGPCAKKVEVTDKVKMISMLGDEVFVKVAKVTLTDLNKYLSASEVEQFTEVTAGARSLKSVVPKIEN